jgi:hypothetical protein
MKIKNFVVTLIIACVGSFPINTSIDQRAVAQTSAQRQKLKALGLPLVLPSYIPPGFQLKEFNLFKGPDKNDNYRALYQGPNSCTFSVNSGPGIGDEVREKTHSLGATVLGSIYISEVFELEPRTISFIGNLDRNRYLFFDGRCSSSKFSLEEGKKIVRSLRRIQ